MNNVKTEKENMLEDEEQALKMIEYRTQKTPQHTKTSSGHVISVAGHKNGSGATAVKAALDFLKKNGMK